LLVAEFLAEQIRAEPGRRIPDSEIAAFLRRAADQYGRYWRKAAREPGAETELAEEALARLAALRLVRRSRGSVHARPALARFAVGQPQIHAAQQTGLPLA
jgi:uncharacterized protein (TIGR02678 family)